MARRSSKPSPLRRLLRLTGRALGVLLLLALAAAGLAYSWLDREILSTLPADLSGLRDYRPPTTCQTFAADGSLVDEFYLERRIWVPLAELPEHVGDAFIAAEDRRFREHEGVDFPGIARAFWVNLQSGRTLQGGSTLTQQLVKNLIVGGEKSYRRKLKEAVLAWRLENELSKDQILELYLNYVALGSGNSGVEAAARDYFGLSARNIDLGQAALLAGLVPAPSRYSPRANPNLARERRALVLGLLIDEGRISREDAAIYDAAPVLAPREGVSVDRPAQAYATEVRREVRRLFGQELPFQAGFQIHTPLDLRVQAAAQAAVREALIAHRQRQGVAIRQLPEAARAAFLDQGPGLQHDAATGAFQAPRPGQCFEAMVVGGLADVRAGTLSFALDPADHQALVRSEDPEQAPEPLEKLAAPGTVLRVCAEGPGAVSLADRPWAEGAAVVLENATGNVVALVGGYEETLEGFVRATQARRQPGSSFKPYVYAAALLHGRSPLDRVLDGPIALPAGGGRTWAPSNYDGGYEGSVPLRRALAKSLNTVAVRLVLETGAAEVARVARALGVRTPLRSDLTIALGSSELTPMDQALGYAAIARGGVTVEPVFVSTLRDVDGRLLGEAGGLAQLRTGQRVRLPGGPGTRALPPGIAYTLADMMREVFRAGTARKAWVAGRDRAGKTGTTNGFQDAWFIGFTPTHTVAVWVGTDGTRTLGDKETGAKAALPAWVRIIDALPDPGEVRLPVPPDVQFVAVDGGLLAAVPRGRGTAPPAGPLPAFGR